jgi:hypothetical protein
MLVARQLTTQCVYEFWALRSRPYETHFAPKNKKQLRKFVNPGAAKNAADTCHPGIVLLGPTRNAVRLRIHKHAPQLWHGEHTPIKADAILHVEGRATAVNSDGRGCYEGERQHNSAQHQGTDDIDNSLYHEISRRRNANWRRYDHTTGRGDRAHTIYPLRWPTIASSNEGGDHSKQGDTQAKVKGQAPGVGPNHRSGGKGG